MQLRADDAVFLSVVIAAGRDAAGPGDVRPAQRFIEAWIAQARRHRLEWELILVEYGTEAGTPSLAAEPAPCGVRTIAVRTARESVARNAGIRSARGQFILATSTGVAFSDELVEWMAARNPQPGRMYRADVLERGDPARLHAREGVFEITAEGMRRNAGRDVTSEGSGIWFDRGWFPAEQSAAGEVSRWIDHDAGIVITRGEGGVLAIDLERGPALDPGVHTLRAVTGAGAPVAEWHVEGRTRIELVVPASSLPLRIIRLCGEPVGRPLPGDPRILHYRVRRCDWERPPATPAVRSPLALALACRPMLGRLGVRPYLRRALRLLAARGADIAASGCEFRPGAGCYALEGHGEDRFRWFERQAVMALRLPANGRKLALLLEPGPAVGFAPFRLSVRQRGGATLGAIDVRGLTYAEIAAPAGMALLDCSAEGGGVASGSDPRSLAFRIFACGSGSAESPAAELPVEAAGEWPAVATGRSAGIDWRALVPALAQTAAPAASVRFLHGRGCGDFVLMAREHWRDVRGYPEAGDDPCTLMPALCYAAHHAGAIEEVLPAPLAVYRAARPGAVTVDAPGPDLIALIEQMRYLDTPVILNRDDWGRGAGGVRP